MDVLYTLAQATLWVIVAAFLLDAVLYVCLWRAFRVLESAVLDSLRNMVKGLSSIPDHDRTRDIHDEIDALLDSLAAAFPAAEERGRLAANIRVQDERKLDIGTYRMERLANVGTASVQVFPLLGILGTVLALGGALNEAVGPESFGRIVSAFGAAIDTTILGLLAAAVYVLIDALAQTRMARLRRSLAQYRDVTRHSRAGTASPAPLSASLP